MKFNDGTDKIIGLFFEVHNVLGCGFLEKVYESALAIEFEGNGIDFVRQAPLNVLYNGEIVGEYFADFIVGDVVVEIKSKCSLDAVDDAQLINYLKASGKKVGLLVNFGREKVEFKRRVF